MGTMMIVAETDFSDAAHATAAQENLLLGSVAYKALQITAVPVTLVK
jgi:hypothetical protein